MKKPPITIDTDLPELQFESPKVATNDAPLSSNSDSAESTTIADFVDQIRSQEQAEPKKDDYFNSNDLYSRK